jgi:membrane-bound lytic murein transglycosylase D
MTIMAKNATEYGLDNLAPEPPLAYDTVEIKSPTHLALVADVTDSPVSELAEMNPALLKGIAPQGYALHVPKNTGANLTAALALIPPERRIAWRMHKVESGETLAAIGRRYGAAPSSIAAVNSMDSAEPAPGERLVIPAAYSEPSAARRSGPRRGASRTVLHRASAQRSTSQRTGVPQTAGARRKPATRAAAPPTVRRKGPAVLTRTASNRQHTSGGQ